MLIASLNTIFLYVDVLAAKVQVLFQMLTAVDLPLEN